MDSLTFSQEYEVNALYTPTFRLSLLSIHQLDTTGYTSTFGHVPSVSTKSTSRRSKRIRERASTSIHITVPSIAQSTKPTTSRLYTASRSAASTVPQCPPATEFPKPTWKSLTISESRLWHCRLAHIHPTALRSLIDGYSKTTQCAPHASRPSTSRRSSKSKSSALQSHVNSYIRICGDHSPRPRPPAIATISYSSTITHATPFFRSS